MAFFPRLLRRSLAPPDVHRRSDEAQGVLPTRVATRMPPNHAVPASHSRPLPPATSSRVRSLSIAVPPARATAREPTAGIFDVLVRSCIPSEPTSHVRLSDGHRSRHRAGTSATVTVLDRPRPTTRVPRVYREPALPRPAEPLICVRSPAAAFWKRVCPAIARTFGEELFLSNIVSALTGALGAAEDEDQDAHMRQAGRLCFSPLGRRVVDRAHAWLSGNATDSLGWTDGAPVPSLRARVLATRSGAKFRPLPERFWIDFLPWLGSLATRTGGMKNIDGDDPAVLETLTTAVASAKGYPKACEWLRQFDDLEATVPTRRLFTRLAMWTALTESNLSPATIRELLPLPARAERLSMQDVLPALIVIRRRVEQSYTVDALRVLSRFLHVLFSMSLRQKASIWGSSWAGEAPPGYLPVIDDEVRALDVLEFLVLIEEEPLVDASLARLPMNRGRSTLGGLQATIFDLVGSDATNPEALKIFLHENLLQAVLLAGGGFLNQARQTLFRFAPSALWRRARDMVYVALQTAKGSDGVKTALTNLTTTWTANADRIYCTLTTTPEPSVSLGTPSWFHDTCMKLAPTILAKRHPDGLKAADEVRRLLTSPETIRAVQPYLLLSRKTEDDFHRSLRAVHPTSRPLPKAVWLAFLEHLCEATT